MKKILNIGWTLLLIVAFVGILAFSNQQHKNRPCPKVNIAIDYGNDMESQDVLLIHEDITHMLKVSFDSLENQPLSNIDLEKIESLIKTHYYVERCNVYQQINGVININIVQRRPIARVFGLSGKSFYLDNNGNIIPVRFHYPARVLLINGSIDDSFYSGDAINIYDISPDSIAAIKTIIGLHQLAINIHQDAFLKKEIAQIYYDSEGNIIMTPVVGSHDITFNSFNNIEAKLNKLKLFYKKGLEQSNWNKYKRINIEYKDQIVCTKN